MTTPEIDYLTRDYEGFRGLMLDALAALVPGWQEDNPGDLGIAVVEVLAYAADYLSYQQDAVATEAYLETARRRVSLRRHARLLDYRISEGTNARAEVEFEVSRNLTLPRGTRLLTRVGNLPPVVEPDSPEYLRALDAGAAVFETVEDLALTPGKATPGKKNRVAADHGLTVTEDLPPVPAGGRYRPRLGRRELTHCRRPGGGILPAIHLRETLPLHLRAATHGRRPIWGPRYDLLGKSGTARHFVVETENDGYARLRFGDDVFGRRPTPGTRFRAIYRVGNGAAGNVGPRAIYHVVTTLKGITCVTNPRPATGGSEPESNDQIRARAPFAFHRQLRCVALRDYVALACRQPGVVAASAVRPATASATLLYILRPDGAGVDEKFVERIEKAFRPYLLIGTSLEVLDPLWVGVEIVLAVRCAREVSWPALRERLKRAFDEFFRPDRFHFGEALELGLVLDRARRVPGVAGIRAVTFQRWSKDGHHDPIRSRIAVADDEIATVRNDPEQPALGSIRFDPEASDDA